MAVESVACWRSHRKRAFALRGNSNVHKNKEIKKIVVCVTTTTEKRCIQFSICTQKERKKQQKRNDRDYYNQQHPLYSISDTCEASR